MSSPFPASPAQPAAPRRANTHKVSFEYVQGRSEYHLTYPSGAKWGFKLHLDPRMMRYLMPPIRPDEEHAEIKHVVDTRKALEPFRDLARLNEFKRANSVWETSTQSPPGDCINPKDLFSKRQGVDGLVSAFHDLDSMQGTRKNQTHPQAPNSAPARPKEQPLEPDDEVPDLNQNIESIPRPNVDPERLRSDYRRRHRRRNPRSHLHPLHTAETIEAQARAKAQSEGRPIDEDELHEEVKMELQRQIIFEGIELYERAKLNNNVTPKLQLLAQKGKDRLRDFKYPAVARKQTKGLAKLAIEATEEYQLMEHRARVQATLQEPQIASYKPMPPQPQPEPEPQLHSQPRPRPQSQPQTQPRLQPRPEPRPQPQLQPRPTPPSQRIPTPELGPRPHFTPSPQLMPSPLPRAMGPPTPPPRLYARANHPRHQSAQRLPPAAYVHPGVRANYPGPLPPAPQPVPHQIRGMYAHALPPNLNGGIWGHPNGRVPVHPYWRAHHPAGINAANAALPRGGGGGSSPRILSQHGNIQQGAAVGINSANAALPRVGGNSPGIPPQHGNPQRGAGESLGAFTNRAVQQWHPPSDAQMNDKSEDV
ncbi:hypothetical protein F5Y15DRAFT_419587 [Xylariaceae sp. FL0016]|nr:hypothetical protein F5Y15DRAFT_419587 [Xylariaceae sp. FL0016]